jgi:hypothetical protein
MVLVSFFQSFEVTELRLKVTGLPVPAVGRYAMLRFWPKKCSIAALCFHPKTVVLEVFCYATALLAEKAAKNL